MLKIILREIITQNFNHLGQTIAQLNFLPKTGRHRKQERPCLSVLLSKMAQDGVQFQF